jgi:Domain of unknown function (DUF4148)
MKQLIHFDLSTEESIRLFYLTKETIMNTKLFTRTLLALASTACATAFAYGDYMPKEPAFVSNLSRAEVKADLEKAMNSGQLSITESGNYVVYVTADSNSQLTRTQVRKDAIERMKANVFDNDNGAQ